MLRRYFRILAVALIVAVVSTSYATWGVAGQATTSTVWSGVYTDEQAGRGEERYNEACGLCHGGDLSGEEYAPPLTAEFFMYRWGDKTVEEFFRKIVTTMPQERPGALTKETYADILAYILKVNGFPAGQTPLDKNPVVLRQIRISRKP